MTGLAAIEGTRLAVPLAAIVAGSTAVCVIGAGAIRVYINKKTDVSLCHKHKMCRKEKSLSHAFSKEIPSSYIQMSKHIQY